MEHHLDSGIVALNKAIDSTYSLIMSPGQYHQHAAKLYERFDINFLQDTAAIGRADADLKSRVGRLKTEVHRKRAMLDSLLETNEFFESNDIKAKLTLSDGISDLEGLRIPDDDHLQSMRVVGRLDDVDNVLKDLEKIHLPMITDGGKLDGLRDVPLISPSQTESIVSQSLLNTAEGRAISQALGPSKELEGEFAKTTEVLKDAGKVKEEGLERIRKKFVDHFAGHEEKITSEIRSMEKLQKKYHSVTDVRYLPKRRTNPERGKPFIERLILGTGFHTDNRDTKWTSVDISPYAGYKFSDRFRAGIGGTYRIAVDIHDFEFSRTDKTFGYRAFGNYRIFNGVFAHLEVQALKTTIPSWFSNRMNLRDPYEPMWVPMAYAGIMKFYSLGRRLQGQTLILYDFLAVSRNFDFNKITFRFGLEYKLKKNKRPETEPKG